jgi:hypothetical protein
MCVFATLVTHTHSVRGAQDLTEAVDTNQSRCRRLSERLLTGYQAFDRSVQSRPGSHDESTDALARAICVLVE